MNGVMGEERVISGHKQASGMSACSASGSGYVLHRQFSQKNVTDCLFSYCEASLHPDFEGFWREKKLSYLLFKGAALRLALHHSVFNANEDLWMTLCLMGEIFVVCFCVYNALMSH